MADHDLPVNLRPESMEWGTVKRSIQSRGQFTSRVEAIEFPGERWTCALTYPPRIDYDAGLAEAFWSRIAGGTERVRLYHFKRPRPLGSMAGAPTINTTAVRGDLSIKINATGDLKAGDFFKAGSQLMQCFSDCAPVGGVITVPLVQRVRATIAAGAAVIWDRPTAMFIVPATSNRVSFGAGIMERFTVDLEEVPV